MYRFRPFETADAAASLGFEPDAVAIGMTVERDGEIAGYGGIHLFERRHWVFFHLADEGLRRPMFLHRLVVRSLRVVIASTGIKTIYALCEDARPRAREWLTALGFRPLTDTEKDNSIVQLEQQSHSTAWIINAA